LGLKSSRATEVSDILLEEVDLVAAD
jgi:hypothetical protein